MNTDPSSRSAPLARALLDRQVEEFMGWLFRDGGAESPRREYDLVEQRLRTFLLSASLAAPEPLAKARDLIANYLWNENGDSEDWLIEAHDILKAHLSNVGDWDFENDRLAPSTTETPV